MQPDPHSTFTAFSGGRRLASGALADVAAAVLAAGSDAEGALVFSDATGHQLDLDLRGGEREVRARYGLASTPPAAAPDAAPRGRGRPRMGVVAREVTLLPEHWQWLAAQPGGASVALRKLVHQASRAGGERERQRRAQERGYRVMVALAGNLAGFEEAARALFAGDRERLAALVHDWPADVRAHVLRLADPGFQPATTAA